MSNEEKRTPNNMLSKRAKVLLSRPDKMHPLTGSGVVNYDNGFSIPSQQNSELIGGIQPREATKPSPIDPEGAKDRPDERPFLGC